MSCHDSLPGPPLSTRDLQSHVPSYEIQYANKCWYLSVPPSSVSFSDGSADVVCVIMEGPYTVCNCCQECSQLRAEWEPPPLAWQPQRHSLFFFPWSRGRNPLFKENQHLWVEAPPLAHLSSLQLPVCRLCGSVSSHSSSHWISSQVNKVLNWE